MEIDIVAQHMPLDGLQEGWAAALQPFEQVGTAETHQPLASFREAIKLQLLCWCRLGFLGWQDIVCQAIARQIQRIDRLNDAIRVEDSIRITGLLIVDGEFDGAGYT